MVFVQQCRNLVALTFHIVGVDAARAHARFDKNARIEKLSHERIAECQRSVKVVLRRRIQSSGARPSDRLSVVYRGFDEGTDNVMRCSKRDIEATHDFIGQVARRAPIHIRTFSHERFVDDERSD